MIHVLSFVILFFSCSLFSTAQETEETSPDDYILVWHDEFDVDGPPNPQNWNFEEGFVRNKELQWYQPQNAWCHGGVLTLAAYKENRPNPNYNSKSHEWGKLRKNIYLSSASITTEGKHEFRFGRFEIRARIPTVPGVWPSIWLLGKKYPWPCSGEIDILSFFRLHGVPSLLASVCWGGEEDVPIWNTSSYQLKEFTQQDSLWSSKFHIWRMDWNHEGIRIYLDDQLLNQTSLTETINAPSSSGADDNPFETPLYILLNLAIGSNGGFFYKETLPIYFDIDYIRVYQKWE